MATGDISDAVLAARRGGEPVMVATVIAAPGGSTLGAKMLVRRDGTTLGSLGHAVIDEAVKAGAGDEFRRRSVEVLYFDASGQPVSRREAREGESFQVMLEVHERPQTLVIIGGGHVGKALATIGHLLGFSVEVVDDRPEYANAERFPEADRITCGRFEEVLADYPIDANTYVICVTRGHRHDEVSLKLVAEKGAAYVGMIGSRRRAGAVLQHLLEEGVDPAAIRRVRTPIGLDIGAQTPEEIAVSVMAEIVMERRASGSGRPMSEGRHSIG